MLKRIPISYEANRGYFVDLPTYFIIAGTWLPVQKGLLHRDGAYPNADPPDVMALKPTVIASIPEDTPCSEDGSIDKLGISKMYAGHGRFDCADYQPPPLLDFHPLELAPPKESTLFEKIAHAMGIGK